MITNSLAVHHVYRLRDLVTGFVVVFIGAAMIYTIGTAGTEKSIEFAWQAFGYGGAAIALAFACGAAVDVLGKRFPVLVRRYYSPLPLVFVITTVIGGAVLTIFEAREWLSTFVFAG